MPKAVLLHGTDGSPDYNWFPWLRDQMEERGYEVWAPLLPNNHTPNQHVYESFLKDSGWDFNDNIIIGHSSGATTALNMLSTEWFPSVKMTILVGTFLNERLLPGIDWYEPGQFDNLFPKNGFNPELLRLKSESFVFLHGDNDPYCAFLDADKLAHSLGAEMIKIHDGLHLSSNRVDLPELLPYL